MKPITTLVSGLLLMASTTASAQFVHLELKDGSKYVIDSKDIKNLFIDNNNGIIGGSNSGGTGTVLGPVTVNGKTFTRTVGGSIANAVDLGLPSGVLWADHNVGAVNPEDYGAYIAWAEVGAAEEGYVSGRKQAYTWTTLKYSEGQSQQGPFSKYTFSSAGSDQMDKNILDPEDDAATVNWGSNWRMPVRQEFDELRQYCIWTWKTVNGVNGYEVKSKYNGNSIFLPAAGNLYFSSVTKDGVDGYYWSSSIYSSINWAASDLYFTSKSRAWDADYRYAGLTVRPVFNMDEDYEINIGGKK